MGTFFSLSIFVSASLSISRMPRHSYAIVEEVWGLLKSMQNNTSLYSYQIHFSVATGMYRTVELKINLSNHSLINSKENKHLLLVCEICPGHGILHNTKYLCQFFFV